MLFTFSEFLNVFLFLIGGYLCNLLTQFCLLKMKAHEENLSEKEKSTEEKAKETGKIPIQNAHIHQVHVFPAETKLLIFMNTF